MSRPTECKRCGRLFEEEELLDECDECSKEDGEEWARCGCSDPDCPCEGDKRR